MNCRHADFQNAKCLILLLFINQLPGRPLRYLQYDAGLFRTEPRKIHARKIPAQKPCGHFGCTSKSLIAAEEG
jgi:hypothetical protein